MWRVDEKGYSSSRSLEGDQGKKGELAISAFQCFYNLLSSWIILFPQTHFRKRFWCGRMYQCLASQGYMAKVMLPHHHLRDMTENLVKNGLTCHYSKSYIWEWILVLGSGWFLCCRWFFFFCVCVHNIYICSLCAYYYFFICTVDIKTVQIYKCRHSLHSSFLYMIFIYTA